MNKLFGVPMTTIMWVLVALFAVCVASVVAIWLSNRVMFRLGLRNIPRRGAQTGLVVIGLMLSTLIITSAFTTGDSLDYSITSTTYNLLQRTDIVLDLKGGSAGPVGGAATEVGGQIYVSDRIVPNLETAFAGDPDIEAFLPFVFERVPVLNPRTRLAEPAVTLAGIDPQRLGRLGGLRLVDGGRADLAALGEGDALISKTTADKLNARQGDTITLYARDIPWQVHIAGVVKDELAGGALDIGTPDAAGGLAMPLAAVQHILGKSGQINTITVALKGGVRGSVTRTDPAAARLEGFLQSDAGKRALGLGDLGVKVDKVKQQSVRQAETFGNLFTTFFLVLGLFSIAAGVMLIFMIFVMLAAERKMEMGIARAVGAQRRNLVQSFVSEGMAYNVMAGAVGAALGVGAAFVLVVGGARTALGSQGSFLTAHATPRSLIVSYCLGTVLTFITVVVSSLRVSRLNIVAAIRGTDDVRAREPRRRTSWRWVALGVLTLPVLPLGLYWLLRKGFGLASAWVWGPLGIAVSLLSILLARSLSSQFFFSMGVSLLPLSLAALARHYRAPNRATWTAVGLYLLLFWLVPYDFGNAILREKLNGNIEMFVLSGIMIVIGFTLVIVFNARLLTSLFQRSGDAGRAYLVPGLLLAGAAASVIVGLALGNRGGGLGQLFYLLAALLLIATALSFAAARYPRFAPALKMGVAYPLANRFRTGMTIAMFSLIVFSIVVMSTLNANFAAVFASDDARGGWDVVAETNRNNPVDNLVAALKAEGSFDTSTITDLARVTPAGGGQEVRQVGQGGGWKPYLVHAGEDAFFAKNQAKLDMRARGIASDRAVFEMVRTTPNVAIMDALPLQAGFGNPVDFRVKGVKAGQKEFEPFQIEMRDPVTGKSGTVTVVGVLSSKILQAVMFGIYTNAATYTSVYGPPEYRLNYLRLAPGTNADAAAKGIKAALVTKGVQAFSIQKRVNDQQAQNKGFSRVFQAYMGLGLFVGIAALGVIAFRSVVERRQQIGMLRAIGYQRGTVALTFLLESSFVAMMGILSGVVGAAILSRNLMTSADFTGAARGFSFFIPWTEVTAFVVLAYGFSLLLTWWPSRGASRVPIAEALRYE